MNVSGLLPKPRPSYLGGVWFFIYLFKRHIKSLLTISPHQTKNNSLILSKVIQKIDMKKKLSSEESKGLLKTLKDRFEKNVKRHKGIDWKKVEAKLISDPTKLWSLNEMEITGGEPDVIGTDKKTGEYLFCDCSEESPKGRRSLCYDRAALNSRKEHKPKNSAMDLSNEIGIELLNEEEYRYLQTLGEFDLKSSSWINTPPEIRKLGGALFCDRRYDTVFVYHNGAESYYAARGFRGSLRV